jgi:hypothetical protein
MAFTALAENGRRMRGFSLLTDYIGVAFGAKVIFPFLKKTPVPR